MASIYQNRNFFVKEVGIESNISCQHFGISQGYPLSLFLFSIIMTILIQDAKTMMHEIRGSTKSLDEDFDELLFADDTLLIDRDDSNVQFYLECIQKAGREYGLELNFDKFELLAVGGDSAILKEDGTAIQQKDAMLPNIWDHFWQPMDVFLQNWAGG